MPTPIPRWLTILGMALAPFSEQLGQADPITTDQKNFAAAITSLDNVLEVLLLQYGLDPGLPDITTLGSFQPTGFAWTTTTTYLGGPLAFTASGNFNSVQNRTTWNVAGSYAGFNWSSTGDLHWSSDTAFDTAHDTSIPGLVHAFTADPSGNPSRDEGSPQNNGQTVKVTYPTSILLGLFSKTDESSWTIPVIPGFQVEETVTIGGSSIGLTGGGTVDLSSGNFKKVTKITPIPEPSSLTMLLWAAISSATLAATRRKRN